MKLFNYKDIDKEKFLLSKPYPNIELDNFWNDDLLEKCFSEILNFKNWGGERNYFAAKKRLYSSQRHLFPENVNKAFDVFCIYLYQ